MYNGCYDTGAQDTITDIIIPYGIETIGDEAFFGTLKLKSVVIPASVKRIEAGAFSKCSSLTEITIPEGVAYIGTGAFSQCLSLTDVTIPSSVTEMGNTVFSYIPLITIHVPWKVSEPPTAVDSRWRYPAGGYYYTDSNHKEPETGKVTVDYAK